MTKSTSKSTIENPFIEVAVLVISITERTRAIVLLRFLSGPKARFLTAKGGGVN